ncbi:MAG: hypothetical protein LBC77_00290 [Spirochaetaceae bacterium]|jgi:class 3 adenylate cyclase/iron only hydrogenase large subunit-like protein|nr:hypothetical protein [Spirochaetaceae bacterium]
MPKLLERGAKNGQEMPQLVSVDRDKCNNCHACISACPVKACIDGSGYRIDIIHERCIGCGKCITTCKRRARNIADDTALFFQDLEEAVPIVAIVAPSAVTAFPDLSKLNGCLKHFGVKAVFDVAFGAELAAKSYLDHIERRRPRVVIAQPCAAVVSFCEIYHPELLQFLAPVQSPMMHTAIMIKEFFPQYKKAKIAAISPCIAKKREFLETGLIDYNVTMYNFKQYLEFNFVDMSSFESAPFDGPAPERAAGFSSPGGLKATILRDAPELERKIRSIESESIVYKYLTDIPQMLLEQTAPLIVDCLSCSNGCNGGVGTGNEDTPVERLESSVSRRTQECIKKNCKRTEEHRKKSEKARGDAYFFYAPNDESEGIHELINRYWKRGLYKRGYRDMSRLLSSYKIPNEKEIKAIFEKMKKRRDADFLNCAACGYGSCRGMAEAIFNGLNREENCHQYISAELELRSRLLYETFGRYLSTEIVTSLLETPSAVVLGGRKRTVTILMSDLRGFTNISETMDVHKVVAMLNHYFSEMVEVIHNYRGTVIEFLGDGILSVFGAPTETPNHADDAIACAIVMQNTMKTVNEWNVKNGYPALNMGIGINTGECIVGNIGSEKTMKYNVIGRHVNLCGRIESYTSCGQIYISENTSVNAKSEIKLSHSEIVHPKGLAAPIKIYLVEGIGFPYNLKKQNIRPPLQMLQQPRKLVFYRVREKYVERKVERCALLAISQSEAVIGCGELDIMDNIRLCVDEHGAEVFAKVIRKIKEHCYQVCFTIDSGDFYNEVTSNAA